MKYGRVIVRCCGMAKNEQWIKSVKEEENTLKGLCELIQMHVATVTGRPQAPANYSTTEAAYATWINETKLYFGIPDDVKDVYPLIVLDTCEVLAELHHTSMKHTSGAPHTLLEAFCSEVPRPRCIVAIGCNAKFEQDEMQESHAHLRNIGPLQPLSIKGHQKALESWGVEGIDPHVRTIVHQLSGGLPRLLRAAHEFPATVTFAYGSFNALPHCFKSYKQYAAENYSIKGKWTFLAYTCLLASSTKTEVRGDDRIPLNPAWLEEWEKTEWGKKTASGKDPPLPTFKDASLASIGTYIPDSTDTTTDATTNATTNTTTAISNTGHFVLPPIVFTDDIVNSFLQQHKDAQLNAPIKPSDLHPFVSIDVIKQLGSRSDLDRGRLFEKPFMYAVYARYLLEFWKNTNKPWVSLEWVFEGAVHPDQVHILERYEANLSGGLVTDVAEGLYEHAARRALSYLGSTYHHDAYIWCREKGNTDTVAEFAVPLQLRHGKPNNEEDQLFKTRELLNNSKNPNKSKKSKKSSKVKNTKDRVKLLLSVNPMLVDVISSNENTIVMIDSLNFRFQCFCTDDSPSDIYCGYY